MLRRIVVGSTIAAASWAAFYATSRWYATWGTDPTEAGRELPGDDLVPDATKIETRGITIDAPPSAVWPWLVQMGYDRAGWYSYDRLDMRGHSADEIHPEWQALAVGDVLHTDPGGGFVVKALEPERSLVVFIDSDLVAEQRGSGAEMPATTDASGLAASGKVMSATMPSRYAASWAFVLEPLGTDRTRLLERVRFGMEAGSRAAVPAGPLLGFGVFVMMQRQMLGIRDRAERHASPGSSPAVAPLPA
jgi:hypothetical protein